MIRILFFAFALSVSALAQTSGTITGTVADSTQAVMPGVTIKALNEQTSEERTTVTNE